MGPTHTSCFSSTTNSTLRISSGWRSFRQSMQAHCRCSSRIVREHWLLCWWHTRSYSWLAEAAIPLAIEVASWPDNVNEPIPRKTVVAKDKLLAEGGLSETKVILGWLFNFQTLTVSLPDHKFIAWIAAIQKMITPKRTTLKDLPLPQSTLFPALPQQKLTICHIQQQVHERFGVNDRQAKNESIWAYSHSEHPTEHTIQICAQLGSGDTATKGTHGVFMSHLTSNFEQPTIHWNI